MHFYLCTNSKHIQKHIFFSHQPTSSDLSIRDNFISWTFHSYHTMAMRAIIWEDILKIYVEMLFSHSVVFNSLQPHESQHARPPVHHQLRSSRKLMSIESVMPSSHLILCRPLLLLPPIPPSIRVFSNESTICLNKLFTWDLRSYPTLAIWYFISKSWS